jgi:hypothetical protein
LRAISSITTLLSAISRTSPTIVALQMALCVVLLVGGGLLIRTLRNLQHISLGFRTEGLVVFGVNPQNIHSVPEGIVGLCPY